MGLVESIKRYLVGEYFCPKGLARAYNTTKIDARVRLQMLEDKGVLKQIKHDVFIPNTDEYPAEEIAHTFITEFDDLRPENGPEPIRPYRFE